MKKDHLIKKRQKKKKLKLRSKNKIYLIPIRNCLKYGPQTTVYREREREKTKLTNIKKELNYWQVRMYVYI